MVEPLHPDDAPEADEAREAELRLVGRLRAGERTAFDALYAAHHARIWAFLLRLSGRRDEAEDLFQETWLSVARHAARLEPDVRLLPWLFTVARNHHRQARRFLLFDFRKRERLVHEPEREGLDADAALDAQRRTEDLEAAFYELTDAHREVLVVVTIEGFVASEAAAMLGVTEEVVRKRLSRARAELEVALARRAEQRARARRAETRVAEAAVKGKVWR